MKCNQIEYQKYPQKGNQHRDGTLGEGFYWMYGGERAEGVTPLP